MSGIVGLWHRDGSRADRDLVRELTQFLFFRGPDSCETWAEGEVALGCAALHTSQKKRLHHQPATLRGMFTVVADARLDARDELVAALSTDGSSVEAASSDAELIVRSYAKWGEDCTSHLAGDFSFAIWDAREGTLFCARDHFGIRPFYFAEFEDQFIFSNTIDCIRLHPQCSGDLDEEAIGDFLLFGLNLNAETTSFREIHRLRPAHSLTVSRAGMQTRRFWMPPVDGRIRYKREQDYVEHFHSLLRQSVRERVDGDCIGIFLSGGLDSSSIAAASRAALEDGKCPLELRAYTVVAGEDVADEELPFARETASFLGIGHETIRLPSLQPFGRCNDGLSGWPEPVDDPFFIGTFHQFRQIASRCRVILDGEGSDNLMHFEMWPYVKDMARRRDWGDMLSTLPPYLRVRGPVWPGVQRRIREAGGYKPEAPRFPSWLNPEFVARADLKSRFEERTAGRVKSFHPVLPKAHATLTLPQWTHLFENENAGVTRSPVEVRFPFLDLRVVKFVLSLPPYPWLFRKTILREAMAGELPEQVRTRPKTPLRIDPHIARLPHPIAEYGRALEWAAAIDQYVCRGRLLKELEDGDALFLPLAIRSVCLNFWLQSCSRVRYKFKAEAHSG